jgi:hypothetical protein
MEITKRQLQDEELTAYHGSPHSFDKFSTQHMGTGEGNQSFGWGLYFTDLESIARDYANRLYDKSKLEAINKRLSEISKELDKYQSGEYGKYNSPIGYKLKKEYDDLINSRQSEIRKNKTLYKVSLHKGKTPEQYTWLEWDKEIKKNIIILLFNKLGLENDNDQININYEIENFLKFNDRSGEGIYKYISNQLGSDKEASLFLLRAGIDGIKYPAESIARGTTSDTARGFNYVVFDENAVNIEKQTQFEGMEISKKDLENQKVINAAHTYITRNMGKGSDYAPNVHELQKWIDDNPEKVKQIIKGELKEDAEDVNFMGEITKGELEEEKKKKADRCLRIARKKIPKSSAYRSGNIVRCRQGEIWKDLKEEEENNINKRKIYVLVGPPSVGKSTWIKNTFSDIKPYVISRDDIVEQIADNLGWTYDDLFVAPPQGSQLGDYDEKYGEVIQSPSYMSWQPLSFSKVLEANNQVQVLFTKRVSNAVNSEKDIVVDMTNMTAGSRKNALKAIQGSENLFEKIAVVFPFEGAEEVIIDVARKRAEAAKRMGKSKTLPDSVMRKMFASFQNVTPEEGFDKVIQQDNRELLSTLNEKWSKKYKRSIDCNNPKGFSQKAHCKGRLKEEEGSVDLGENVLDKTFIHETDADFDKFDLSKVGSGQGEQWLGNGIYLQEKGSFKIEKYGKNKIETTLNPNAKIFNVENTPNGKYRDSFVEWAVKNTEVGKRKAQERIDDGLSLDNLLPRDIFKRNPEAVEKLKEQGYDGLYQDGELVVYNPNVLQIKSIEKSLKEKTDYSKEKKQGLHGWFARQGGKGKSKGWVDCNTCRDGKCKSCGRKEGESRSKYPACRPTPSACKTKGKGKSWGKKSTNEDVLNEQSKQDIERELKLNEIKNLFQRHIGKL